MGRVFVQNSAIGYSFDTFGSKFTFVLKIDFFLECGIVRNNEFVKVIFRRIMLQAFRTGFFTNTRKNSRTPKLKKWGTPEETQPKIFLAKFSGIFQSKSLCAFFLNPPKMYPKSSTLGVKMPVWYTKDFWYVMAEKW